PLDKSAFLYNRDSVSFWAWAQTFKTRCEKKGWLSIDSLADKLQACLHSADSFIPKELMLVGFDELTPQQRSLLDHLEASGCTVRWVQLDGRQSQVARTCCVDVRQEAETVARWIRLHLDDNPQKRMGVVVPELTSHRDIVTHALNEVLTPYAYRADSQSTEKPYNISLGSPLNHYPVISTALNLLGLLAPTISLDDVSRLLRSPFISGWEDESSSRALLDARLRDVGELQVSMTSLHYYASQTGKPYSCPLLVNCLDAWIKTTRDNPHPDTPSQWSTRFTELLKAIGWASGRPLSSEEYQATEAWRELLGTFATLDTVMESMSVTTAVIQLQQMAVQRTFQPQSGRVPVQVMGMLEASGLQFDHLWIMGLDDGVWPAPLRSNPFIPLPLQKEAGLPHSSEERELHASRMVANRLLTSADEVMVSYSQRSGDEELRPSPFITHLPVLSLEDIPLWSVPTWRNEIHASASLATLENDPAPALENNEARGGSAVYKLQAACPFRAFAELRLGARPLRAAGIGLDAMARGILMHSVLEKVWTSLESHQQLIAMDDSNLDALINAKVDEAIGEIAYRYPQTFTQHFTEMEAERLCRHIKDWLTLEKLREPFVVIEKEGRHEVEASGVSVKLTIDRVDQLADGRQVVIDYKTGNVQASQWFGDRPDEPQLPLYSMAISGDIAGVLFAQVKAGGMAFKGVTEDEKLVPGVKSYDVLSYTKEADSWSQVLNDWRATMEVLANDFRVGEAAVDPKKYPDTCTYCELKPLCRINESTVLDGEE
ncbi:MAG: PD-(D/E)XK nuclease family protein, partial [Gammaproteobacteria bacterium]|nr:PD-(D/E)XK nuclease family protein [Gammaproteobacteria bacterium]